MQTEQKNKFRLTEGSYYSKTANEIFMSASQFKSFRKCQACALAELRGEYVQPKTTALLVGSYVDAAFEGPHAFSPLLLEILKIPTYSRRMGI